MIFKTIVIIALFYDFIHNLWLEIYLKDLYKKLTSENFNIDKHI